MTDVPLPEASVEFCAHLRKHDWNVVVWPLVDFQVMDYTTSTKVPGYLHQIEGKRADIVIGMSWLALQSDPLGTWELDGRPRVDRIYREPEDDVDLPVGDADRDHHDVALGTLIDAYAVAAMPYSDLLEWHTACFNLDPEQDRTWTLEDEDD